MLLLVLANAAGVVMLVAGLLSRGPAPFAGQTLEDPAVLHRITRHPVFMGTSLMAVGIAAAVTARCLHPSTGGCNVLG